ncbi:MAG: C25 family cysteine peptidase, partial [Bacteroidota bacterium]
MKRTAAVLGVLLLVSIQVTAQVGNEWIIPSQAYFKIPVAKDGLYKVTYADLQAAGFPVGAADPTRFQLFHRGVEQAIYVEGESDAQFDASDFIEFYGRKNDGTLDKELYQPTTAHPHTYYNLYSDTTAYFLTIASSPGKRMVSFQEDNTGLPAETHHVDEKLMVLKDQYAGGINYGDVQNTYFDLGEGWTGAQVVQTQSVDYVLDNILLGVTTAGLPSLELMLVGRGQMEHAAEVYVGTGLRLAANINFSGFNTYQQTIPLEWPDIAADGKLTVRIKVVGIGGLPDRLSASYLKLTYPQEMNAANAAEKIFILAPNAGDKSYIEIQNPAAGTRLFDITDPSAVKKIIATSAGTLNATVPSTSNVRKIFATNVTTTPKLKRVVFRDIQASDYNYIIISNPLLRKPVAGYSDPVKAYAEYRASAAGGGYDTIVMNTQQLFDQFNYGESSSLAIYHFMKYSVAGGSPRYLFLIGKGLDIYYRYYRNPTPFTTYKDFVPPAGWPGSDMAYTAGLNGTTYEPAVPTGRIPAIKPEDVAAYLNKIKETEARAFDDLRRKNVLHLSGGIFPGEPQEFRTYMKDFEQVAVDFHLGGQVRAIAKQSTDIQLINISDEVNKGLNLVTFFGHSSPTTLDFDIGYVTDPVLGYNNKGKYPMLLMNGCDAGAFFLNTSLFGENWINTPDKGAIGFIAHSSFGLVGALKKYTDIFYEVGYGDSTFIYKGIGDIQKETGKRLLERVPTSPVFHTQVQQMVLLADPAAALFGARKVDYEVIDNNVFIESFDGEPVTARSDSFAIKFIVRNFGQAKEDTFRIEVTRKFNDNSTITYDSLFAPVLYSDTLMMVIRKSKNDQFGNNTFTVDIDADGIIAELNENNNTASIEYFIPLNGTKNLFPRDFAILTTSQVNLSFQNTDALSVERDFLLEVDTVDTFSSAFKKSFTVKGTVLASQSLSLPTQDSLTYYWRTKLAQPTENESKEWTTTSFTYIDNGQEGWAQMHFPQYLKNASIGLVKDPEIRRLKFEETVT